MNRKAPQPSRVRPSDPRSAALRILERIESGAGYSNILLASEFGRTAADEKDRALTSALVLGVTERRLTLDYFISCLSSRPDGSIDGNVRNVIRMGMYQLAYMDGIPAHAAVNETVKLLDGLPGADRGKKAFANALLREFARRSAEGGIPLPDRPRDDDSGFEKRFAGYLSVVYSAGRPLCRRLAGAFGPEKAEKILAASFGSGALTLCVNTLRCGREELIRKLADTGVEAVPDITPRGVKLAAGSGLPSVIGEGIAFVQDTASQICCEVLGAMPGESLLDVCAAPGSKSFCSAMRMEGRGRIVCRELRESRLPLIDEGASRLGIGILSAAAADSSVPVPEDREAFDRVLCDVPCSGYGVIGRKPELRYRDPASSADLPELQSRILRASAEAVRPGGVLVYSTCTLLPAENSGVVGVFLKDDGRFAAEPFESCGFSAPDGMLTLTPDGGTDGFFIAKLRKLRA